MRSPVQNNYLGADADHEFCEPNTMSKTVLNGANFCTAYILGDRERPREMEGPPSRQLCRLILTSVAVMGFAVVVTLSLLNQPPKRSQRFWIGQRELGDVGGFLDKMALQLNSAEWNCPCKTMNTISRPKSSAHIVDFYILKEEARSLHIKTIQHFCGTLSASVYFQGFFGSCMTILINSFQSSGWNPYNAGKTLYMNSLRTGSLNPVAFMFDVCMAWAGGISQASSSFLISHFHMNRREAFQLEKFLNGVKTSVRTCAMYTSWPPPSETTYAREANAVDPELMKMQLIVAIKFNWTEYMHICAPSYCEHLKLNSAAWNLFTALAQMGGFISVAVFALRTLVWPAVCFMFGWPTSSSAAGPGRVWMDYTEATPASSHTKSSPHLRLKRSRTVTF